MNDNGGFFMRKLRQIFSILILIFTLFTVFGCSNINKDTSQNTSNQDQSVKEFAEIIQEELEVTNASNLSNFEIISTFIDDKYQYVHYLFNIDGKSFEGLCSLAQVSYKIIYNDYTVIDQGAPFTIHEISGGKDDHTTYLFIGGVINNQDINSMNIEFNDDTIVNIRPLNSTYSYVKDKIVSIKRITALDAHSNIIFTYPPYPPTGV
jgi:hypothetical protein